MRCTICLLVLSLVSTLVAAEEPAGAGKPGNENRPAEEEPSSADEKESADPTRKILRQKTRLLRACPKRYAVFRGADASRGEVELLMEGEEDVRIWRVDADAEIKVHGFWGRLEEMREGDRLWTWIRLDRRERPVSLFMIADEISEQVIHGLPYTLRSFDAGQRSMVLERQEDEPRTLRIDDSLSPREDDEGALAIAPGDETAPHQPAARLRVGDAVYVQTTGTSARIIVGREGLTELREGQRSRLHRRWNREGIPATVGLLHRFAGEVEIALDHEGMRWARHLKPDDRIEINIADPVPAIVLDVAPWQERTRLRVAARGGTLSELSAGERIHVRVPEPPPEVLSAKLPPDLDRGRTRTARVAWFLASTYCSCSIAGDGCTGMFYTLASCNPETCGMPNRIRKRVGELLDEGLSDREVFAKLEEDRGDAIFESHLLR